MKKDISNKLESNRLHKTIGERMRQARELCNLTQLEAAKRLGYLNSSKLSKIENAQNSTNVPLWVIQKASSVYEVSIDFLFGQTEDWEVGARMTQERDVSAWIFNFWQETRAKDMKVLLDIHQKIDALSRIVSESSSASREVGESLERIMNLNPSFEEDMRGGARLVTSIEKMQAVAKQADATLNRFKFEFKSVEQAQQIKLL